MLPENFIITVEWQVKLRVSIRFEMAFKLPATSYKLQANDYQLTTKRQTVMSSKSEPFETETPATILVVDDEWMNRELMQAVLESAGYRVLLAAGSADALELAHAEKPNLVIMDVRLRYPTEGYDLCRKLKSDPAMASTRLAILTAMESAQDRALAKEVGADAYLNRIMDISEILRRVDELLTGSADAAGSVESA